jgi:PAS domain S-box-containing protein
MKLAQHKLIMPPPLRILVVDDDPQQRQSTCRLLEQAGYLPTAAATRAEALAVLGSEPPPLVLLDHGLPDLDGWEIGRLLKANPATADVVFVVLVAGQFIPDEAPDEGMEAGADGYIARPIGNREMLARVATFARLARLTRQLAVVTEEHRQLAADGEQRVVARTAELTTAVRKLEEARRAAFSLVEDATLAQKRLTSTNQKLRREIAQLRRAGKTLRASEQRMRALLDSLEELVFVLDRNLVFLEYRPPPSAELLVKPDFFAGKRFDEVGFPEPANSTIKRALEQTLQTGVTARTEYWLDLPYGRSWHELHVSAFLDPKGTATSLTCVVRNITSAKQAEMALRESKRRLAALLGNLPGMAYRCRNDRDWTMEFVSEGCLALTGYPAADLMGNAKLSYANIIHPADREQVWAAVQQALAQRARFQLNYRIHTAGGETRRVWEQGLGVYAQDGALLALEGLALDVTQQQQAEENLRETNEYLDNLFNHANAPIIVWDPQFKITRFNCAFEALTGRRADEVIGQSLELLFPPESVAGSMALIRQTLAGKRWETVEIAIQPRAGTARTLLWNSATLWKADGLTPVATIAQGQDITERQQAQAALRELNQHLEQRVAARTAELQTDITERRQTEAALRASEEKYRMLFESAADAILIADEAGKILAANQVAQVWLGYTAAELLTMGVADVNSAAESAHVKERLAKLKAQGQLHFETTLRRQDGSLFPIDASARQIVWNGQPAVIAIIRDLTERRRAEAQLRKLQSAVEHSPLAVIITDAQGTIEYVNPRFATQTGFPTAEALGQNPHILSSGHHPREFFAGMWRTLLSGHHWHGEICNQRKDGVLFWEATAIAPILDSADQLTHFVAIKEDITERRRLQEELRQAKQAAEAATVAKTRFLANMSHEIRTPLNSVLGFAQLLQRDPALTPQQAHHLGTINRNGEYLLRLISDVLDMSKIEAGRVPLTLVDCQLRSLLEDMEAVFRLRTDGKGLRFTVQTGAEVPTTLHTDAGKVRQVIFNVLGNAVKFTTQGSIAVCATAEPAPITATGQTAIRLRLTVTDTGPGIAPEDCELVFAAFEQTRVGQTQGGGTGLGLAISRQLAHMMGGDLTVTSKVGVGSTFHFTFVATVPASASVTPARAPALGRIISLKPGTPVPPVLVVDDSESNRELLRGLLEGVGYAVSAASDGFEAVAHCQANRPALILMDRRMPGMDGLATTRAIRACPAGSEPRILMVSADVLGTSDEDWHGAGLDGFIAKPFNNADLLLRMGELLGVDYLYETAALAPSVPRVAFHEAAALPAAVVQLPATLRAELIQATESGDRARLQKLITESVQPQQPELAEALSQWAAQYSYKAILQAMNSAKTEAGEGERLAPNADSR